MRWALRLHHSDGARSGFLARLAARMTIPDVVMLVAAVLITGLALIVVALIARRAQ